LSGLFTTAFFLISLKFAKEFELKNNINIINNISFTKQCLI